MIEIRKAKVLDVKDINSLFYKYSGRRPDINLSTYIEKYPAIVLLDNLRIVGFCYSKPFAPDIIELMNIFIKPKFRNNGLGKKIIGEFENTASKSFSAVILVNSSLYPAKENKQLANNFYKNCLYTELYHTEHSKIYIKKINHENEENNKG